jgi:DNA-binding NarL/FixJ family response regulator
MNVLVAIHDLMFSSKVTAASRGKAGVSYLPRGSKIVDHIKAAAIKPDVLLVDLASANLDAVNATKALKVDHPGLIVIGYVDHTREDVMAAARAAGVDQVMSKGEFARRLPELLEGA